MVRGYRPDPLPLRLLKRQWRDIQTYAPSARAAKYRAFNALTRHLGLLIDPEIALLSRLAPVQLALDIGGNWGQTVHAFKRHLRPARIVAVEPNPELADSMRRDFPASAGVDVLQMALGHAPGHATLHVPRYRDYAMDGLASLDMAVAADWLCPARIARFDPALQSIDSYPVEVQPLDALGLAPDVINIDVQGTETAVALGGMDTIAQWRPAIIVERPDDAFVHLVGKAGLAPYRWDGKQLHTGDLTGKNTLFLSTAHLATLQQTGNSE